MKSILKIYCLLFALLSAVILLQEAQGAAKTPLAQAKSDLENKLVLIKNKLAGLSSNLNELHTKLNDLKQKLVSPSGATITDQTETVIVQELQTAKSGNTAQMQKDALLMLASRVNKASPASLQQAATLVKTTIKSADVGVIIASLALCEKLAETKTLDQVTEKKLYQEVIQRAEEATKWSWGTVFSLTSEEIANTLTGLTLFKALVEKGQGIDEAIVAAEKTANCTLSHNNPKHGEPTIEDLNLAGIDLFKTLVDTTIREKELLENKALRETITKKAHAAAQQANNLKNTPKVQAKGLVLFNAVNILVNMKALLK